MLKLFVLMLLSFFGVVPFCFTAGSYPFGQQLKPKTDKQSKRGF